MATPEQAPKNPESLATPEVSEKKYDELRDKIEKGAEIGFESAEKSAARAKAEAMETALSVEKGGAEKKRHAADAKPTKAQRRGAISKKEKEASFKRHMQQAQTHMSAPSRVFSKFIHNKAVERTSEAVGSTIARPNAILSGAIAAFILVLATYLIAKHFGYVLSGFETIAAFGAGWLLGILYDYLRVMVTGKK